MIDADALFQAGPFDKRTNALEKRTRLARDPGTFEAWRVLPPSRAPRGDMPPDVPPPDAPPPDVPPPGVPRVDVPPPDDARARFRATLIRVMIVQAVALVVLWLLQIRYDI